MSCALLQKGFDLSCGGFAKKYFQQLVLVNRADLLSYSIQTKKSINLTETECRHRVRFKLKEGKTGYRFSANEKGSNIFGTYEKSKINSRTEYAHKIQLILSGTDEELKCLIRNLDNGNYFGALQFYDGTVEIFGFEYGLTTNDYTSDLQANRGIIYLELISDKDALEDEPPFIYFSDGNENDDFNNNFDSNPVVELGDFNDDFNNDFFVTA